MNICKYTYQLFVFLAFTFVNAELFAQNNKSINDLFSEGVQLEWNRFYEGKIADVHDCVLQLAYDGFNCKGFLTIASSQEEFVLEGSLENGNIQLVEKYKSQPSSYVNGKIEANKLDLVWEAIGGEIETSASFISMDNFTKKGLVKNALNDRKANYYDFYIDRRMDLPGTNDVKFQSWVQKKVSSFQTDIDEKINQTNLTKRSQLVAGIDHKVFFENEDFINGELLFYTSWSAPKRINFLYDKKSNKEIKFDQLLKDSKAFYQELNQLIFAQAESLGKLEYETYAKMMKSRKIEALKVNDNGIEFSSKFHPVYGNESVLIGCEKLERLIKKNYYKRLVCSN